MIQKSGVHSLADADSGRRSGQTADSYETFPTSFYIFYDLDIFSYGLSFPSAAKS
jgi:hypothetical protein